MISSILRHVRNGTFGSVVKSRLGRQNEKDFPRTRWTANTEDKAIEFLLLRVHELVARTKKPRIAVVGSPGQVRESFLSQLGTSVDPLVLDPSELKTLRDHDPANISCVVSTCFDAFSAFEIGQLLLGSSETAQIPFENVVLTQLPFDRIEKVDRYRSASFTSPLFAEPIDFISIYKESLTRFGQKCEIRDYLDLCQGLLHVVRSKIPGGIAEFGSYKGHSGYLIAQTLKELKSDKPVLLFDMFQEFPKERLGIDYFWDGHEVNFEEVREKFRGFDNVQLVKGDFTETIRQFPDLQLSLIYIDCDSYRATKFLINHLFHKHLSPGGLLIIEDYGHPALLGSRLAVHESLNPAVGFFSFYSQFSGFYIVAKNF